MEVYYICVILGFRGVYENPSANAGIIEQYGLPPSLEDWLAENAEGIHLGRVPPVPQAVDRTEGAPPLEGHAQRSKAFFFFGLALTALVVVLILKLLG